MLGIMAVRNQKDSYARGAVLIADLAVAYLAGFAGDDIFVYSLLSSARS